MLELAVDIEPFKNYFFILGYPKTNISNKHNNIFLYDDYTSCVVIMSK